LRVRYSLFPLPAHSVAEQSSIPTNTPYRSYRINPILHDRTLCIALFRLSSFLALLDLSNHSFKSFADILVIARARFGETAAQLFGEFLAVGEGDLALFGAQIGLVADDCEGNGVGALEGGDVVSWRVPLTLLGK
jgi:hypothetical protein